MPGSLSAIGARNEFGYQVRPDACGARIEMSGTASAAASPSMSSADAPRPCTMIITARADAGAGPCVRTGCPRCGSFINAH